MGRITTTRTSWVSAHIVRLTLIYASSVVESYTFNFNVSQMIQHQTLLTLFQYFEDPGTGVRIPVMSLGEDLMKMSLNDRDRGATESPKPPTLGEVKKSLRVREKVYLEVTANHYPLVSCKTVNPRGESDGRTSKSGAFFPVSGQ